MNYRQYLARDYFVEVDHPQAGRFRYAGWPYKMPASPPAVQRPAPLLGQHNRRCSRACLDTLLMSSPAFARRERCGR